MRKLIFVLAASVGWAFMLPASSETSRYEGVWGVIVRNGSGDAMFDLMVGAFNIQSEAEPDRVLLFLREVSYGPHDTVSGAETYKSCTGAMHGGSYRIRCAEYEYSFSLRATRNNRARMTGTMQNADGSTAGYLDLVRAE